MAKAFQPHRFVSRCPLCAFRAVAVRYGMDREALADHFLKVHTLGNNPHLKIIATARDAPERI